MSVKAYVSQHLKDKDQTILDAVNATTFQEKIAPKATDEIIKALDVAGLLDKATIVSLTQTTVVDHSIAFDDLGRLAELDDITAARKAVTDQTVELLVRDIASRRINQLWDAIAVGKVVDESGVIAEFSK